MFLLQIYRKVKKPNQNSVLYRDLLKEIKKKNTAIVQM